MPPTPRRRDSAATSAAAYELVLPTDLSQVAAAVEALVGCCQRHLQLSPRGRFRVCTVAAEAITNAMSYGNNHEPSLRVTVQLDLRDEMIVLAVTDEGDGFDPDAVPELGDPECHEATRGRGLFIIRQLAESVTFNDRGNTIWVTLQRH
jgi:serine/threonine-protein kinase RsbW